MLFKHVLIFTDQCVVLNETMTTLNTDTINKPNISNIILSKTVEKQQLISKSINRKEAESNQLNVVQPKIMLGENIEPNPKVKNALCGNEPFYCDLKGNLVELKTVATSMHKINKECITQTNQSEKQKDNEKHFNNFEKKNALQKIDHNIKRILHSSHNSKPRTQHSHKWSEICPSDVLNINEIVEHIISESRPSNVHKSSRKRSNSPSNNHCDIKNIELNVTKNNVATKPQDTHKLKANSFSQRPQNFEWKHLLKDENHSHIPKPKMTQTKYDESDKLANDTRKNNLKREACTAEFLSKFTHKANIQKSYQNKYEAEIFKKSVNDNVMTEGAVCPRKM